MVWFTSKMHGVFGPVLLHGRLVGDETGLWLAGGVLFVAIAAVGGGLLAFLIQTVRDSTRAAIQLEAESNGATRPNG